MGPSEETFYEEAFLEEPMIEAAMAYLSASLTDSEGTKFLFPHRSITTMSIADAEALQTRLIAIDKFNEDNRLREHFAALFNEMQARDKTKLMQLLRA